jgi:hypothetical protein
MPATTVAKFERIVRGMQSACLQHRPSKDPDSTRRATEKPYPTR